MSGKGKSLRTLIREAANVRTSNVLYGTVKAVNPIEIQVDSDQKLLLDEDNLYIPEHLTNYEVKISVSGGGGSTSSSDGHSHSLSSVSFSDRTMTIKNALKVGEGVFLLSFDRGELYFVLDRVG